jgi:hypothetical protein
LKKKGETDEKDSIASFDGNTRIGRQRDCCLSNWMEHGERLAGHGLAGCGR